MDISKFCAKLYSPTAARYTGTTTTFIQNNRKIATSGKLLVWEYTDKLDNYNKHQVPDVNTFIQEYYNSKADFKPLVLEKKELSYEDCPVCQGGKMICGECDGVGIITCKDCKGTGKVVCGECGQETYCENCNGEGTYACDICKGSGKMETCNECGNTGKVPIVELVQIGEFYYVHYHLVSLFVLPNIKFAINTYGHLTAEWANGGAVLANVDDIKGYPVI